MRTASTPFYKSGDDYLPNNAALELGATGSRIAKIWAADGDFTSITIGTFTTGVTNTQVLYSDAGAIAGDTGMTWTKASDLLTVGGLALGAGSLTMSGSLADTTNRVTKGWFTAIQSTNSPILDDLTASELVASNGTKQLQSLAVATYPSLTEISYVKDVTSAIQSQINAKGTGTVTSVAAITLGTTGTDLSSSVATGTTTPVITLNVPTASTSNRGALSSTDWDTFNGKGVGDMLLGTAQSVTETKTFTKGKLLVKGTSTGTTDLTTANTSATSYTATFPAKTGTVAMTTDITGTNSGTNTGDEIVATGAELDTGTDNVKYASAKAIKDSHNVPSVAPSTAGKVLTSNGTDWISEAPVAGGDMVLADAQSNTGIKTFDKGTLKVKGTSTGSTDLTTANTSATSYAQTFPARDGTVANLDNVTYIGTTSVALNRGSAAIELTGITSIDGASATCSGLAASATILATTRAIYGNNFDGSAALTQVIGSAYGGTGNGFTKFTGPTTAEKTFTLPDANSTLLYSGGALGTPSGGTLSSCGSLPVSGITASTATALGVGSIELGHASDTTVERSAAGVIKVEGVVIPSISSTSTLTNKRITKRVASTASDATAAIDSDSYDEYYLTGLTEATEITVTGTPTNGQTIFIGIKDDNDAGGYAITWTGITGLGVTLPATTTANKQHVIGIKYIASAWRAIAVGVEA